MRLTALTYNVHHGRGRDGVVDLGRATAAIRAAGPDLLALQELDRGVARSSGTDQPAALAAALGMRVWFLPTLRLPDGGRYGIGLAARIDLEVRFLSLPRLGREEPRGAIVARRPDLAVIATHLARERGPRDLQLHALAALVPDLGPRVVLLGDLNGGRRALGPLRRAGLRPAGRRRATVGPPWWRRQVDHILVSPGVGVHGAATVGGDASDHRGLIVHLEV